ncbi:MAG: ankyrin repeat domain-containing protein, partial [Longimicrobiales bacterium]
RVTPERFPTRGERAAEHIYAYTIGSGFTLLHAAALADRPVIVGWLVAHGCDPEVRGGYDDQTPLHTAAWNDAAAAARALLDAGAAIDARSGEIHRNEPLGWAIVSGAPNIVRLLLERGATVRDNHRDAATRGAGGEFRDFNRRRPIHAWQEIAVLLAP